MLENQMKKFYNLSAPILINGETGTGKSRLARMLFEGANIHKEKFLTLHLASIKEELFESELFGHKKGAFTGASENKNGFLKEVGNGTLFLDEIGELSLEAQKKLLYLLEEKKFVPVGSTFTQDFRGRIIMATNRNLKEMVQKGTFREDLFFRLMVFQIQLEPIRTNKSELQAIIAYYFNNFKEIYRKHGLMISEELQTFLENNEWPGNIREVKNSLEAMVAMSDRRELCLLDLPDWMKSNEAKLNILESFDTNYGIAMDKFEELYLRHMLNKFEGKVNETARQIKISKVNLINKSKKYRINTLKMRVDANDIFEKAAA